MANVVRHDRYIKSDVGNNNNKFWYITEYDDGSVHCQWGRVGTTGQQKTFPFPSQTAAANYYDKKCKAKEKPKKKKEKGKETAEIAYRKLAIVDGEGGAKVVSKSLAKAELKTVATEQIKVACKYSQALLEKLVKENVHNILSNTTMTYNADKGLFSTPCGIVSQENLDEARKLLAQLGGGVDKKRYDNKKFQRTVGDYLMLIPQKVGRKLDPRVLFPDVDAIRRQNDILDSLEASLQSMLAGSSTDKTKKKVQHGAIFNTQLEVYDDKRGLKRIEKKYRSTLQLRHACAHLDVARVFHVNISGMAEKFEKDGKKVGGVMELWHGTKVSNLLSIMSKGLIIPPSNAAYCTGRMFGNGVYFSDQSTKSLNYSHGYWGGGQRDHNCYMFLCDVAMGKYYTPKNYGYGRGTPPKGHDSTYAKAGVSGVHNNEMIVYRTSQCNLIYLVEFAPAKARASRR